jgi:hypothetical protein
MRLLHPLVEPVSPVGFTVLVNPLEGRPLKTDIGMRALGFQPLILLDFLELRFKVGLEFFAVHKPLTRDRNPRNDAH